MAIPFWSAGTLYQPGDLVRPVSAPPAVTTPPANAGFESGDTGWVKGSGWTITSSPPYRDAFDGSSAAYCSFTGTSYIQNSQVVPVNAGQSITAECMASQSGTADKKCFGAVGIRWLTAASAEIAIVIGNEVQETSSGTPWRRSTVTAVAPANAAFAQLIGQGRRISGSGQVGLDAFSWNYSYTPALNTTVYRATQANAGYSGSTEPAWPGFGNTVVDNEVTWEGVEANRVTWEASPILLSGATEPTFPTELGGTVGDGSIVWLATTGQVDQAPQSKAVALAASKIFAGDDDIVPYSGTINPRDWQTTDDAGYLPFGLNNYGANPCAALALYRSNLVAFNAGGYQMWQVDPDPQNMAILDAQPIGSTWPRAIQSVADDLLFLTKEGVRNLGAVGPSASMQSGEIGQAVDPIVKARLVAGTYSPISLYYPARGQYWLIFGPEAIVLTVNGSKKSWSRYVFPEAITDYTLADEDLYLRTASHKVWRVDETLTADDVGGTPVGFIGRLQWPYIDAGALGINRMMVGFDLVGSGSVAVQVGFNQADKTSFCDHASFATSPSVTPAYTVAAADTVPGQPVPMPITAPSFSLILTFDANQAWELQAASLYLNDDRGAGATT